MYDKLKKVREERGITQDIMASLLGYKHKSGYSKLELGERKMSVEQAKIISDFFGMSIDDIFFENKVNKMTT
ncbi:MULTISPECIES: helix-turn-helix transcriptional regulator [Clostridium]|uniref:Conserved domain protein n=2 Tax=Clostridium butyricum TaxID=1492 RepID=C4II66_CLOBU|nr:MULTISPECIES: helix-turn-helix transcriptional regulator [Clostridium]EDT75865.1 conserved domain protein [Clostridium butyricum 5521]EEP54259.1 conserved domain protein [Clostridium butyricum E4 str. BoNT E BL5262]MDU0323813.1 helix-turn-helix transcriptional regulator [Clostridium butyricum]MDU6040312.1 helix-turn-helix transcriptional regulator [Clostridium butyricum]NFL33133.1 helix-turn-helix transcriptional regulator [Clostridium butyricum]